MTRIDVKRHRDLIPPQLYELPMTVIGVGGVGSHLVEFLARMLIGSQHRYIDGDTVEAHNPPNQQFLAEHIGRPKVQALAEQADVWADRRLSIGTLRQYVTEPLDLTGVVFLCLDRMADRRNICEQSLFGNDRVPIALETRMDASVAEVWVFDPNNPVHRDCWLEYWYPDDETENETGCGGHYAVATAASATAVLAVQSLINHYRNGWQETPNRTRLDLRTMELTTKFWPTTLDPE